MQHLVGVQWLDGSHEMRDLSLVVYGCNKGGYSAMAKTVGLPTAIATKMVLSGNVGFWCNFQLCILCTFFF